MRQEEQKKIMYHGNMGSLYATIMYEKTNNMLYDFGKRLTGVESEMENLRELIHSDNHTANDNQFWAIGQRRTDDFINHKMKGKRAERRLEAIVSELNDVDDKKLQVQIVGELVDEIRSLLRDIPKQKNNYRRQMLLMFHEALKQNYTKNIFNETQTKALTETARLCGETFITREQYLKMDDILCECDLDMMPDVE